ncbi:NUDIX hydrolase [Ectobacillus panaciterrae]|uniref:NUDIX hydrolase n=1 Tax=Ectobacillus panaciterrae TaxID=363872 RepID=UPI0003FB4EE7|nr:CoA pyrophosphatase [Ectobacillus panaciterrae]
MDIEKLIAKLSARTPAILGMEQFSKFAVLLPLIKKNNEIHILFEVRSANLRRQPGEICFPGGRIDESDKNPQHAAIRETSEELGLPKSAVTNVFALDYMVSPFGTIIYPYVGVIADSYEIQLNPSEVGEIFTVPLTQLQIEKPAIYKTNYKVEPEQNFPFDLIAGGENYNWQTRSMNEYFYHYEGKVIWGLTARILKHFLDVLGERYS